MKSIFARNILSFGADGLTVDLQSLNVIVGPNGSGKSNFLELFRLLHSSPDDIRLPFLGGGAEHWRHKGLLNNQESKPHPNVIEICLMTNPKSDVFQMVKGNSSLRHKIGIYLTNTQPAVVDEDISLVGNSDSNHVNSEIEEFYSYELTASATIAHFNIERDKFAKLKPVYISERLIEEKDLDPGQSILAQRNDPEFYPFLSELSNLYKGIHLFTENIFGRASPARLPQDAALDSTFLFPDASNLALVLNDLQNQPSVMKTIIEKLKLFYERAENIITRVQGGTVQIFFQEEGLTQTVPASRLSDGTLRYLCLLVILCHPSPPPLICIEEPELGMHPDVLPTIAELLIEASQRTQLIITTHSDLLVSAIGGKHPEAIVVCEKGDNGTTMKRLEPEKMQEWLTRYSLGDLWLKGEIGGTRW